ncbi:12084_t:CDS:2 [Entrophospora sp. SA101]|nr:12084_t:CDS:2 [Entrophospora sp. SA101]
MKNTWDQAIAEAEKLVQHKGGSYIDPMKLVGADIIDLTKNIKRLLGSKHPLLDTVSKYYFLTDGKHIRPLIVLLMSQATNDLSALYYPSISSTTGAIILPTQRRLAEITEMIHTASLLHDDVIDLSETRRNQPSANMNFGNKMAILAGDFLLARASIALARLPASILGGSTVEVCDIAYNYGRNLGLAFQLVDDMLDFVITSKDQLGKPVGADLKLGLATAPVLYAWEEYPEIGPLVKRKFSEEGDVEMARKLVYQSNGIEKTKLLASSHCQKAITAISQLPESDARDALIQLAHKVLIRKK